MIVNKGVMQYQQAQHDSQTIDEEKIVGKIMQKASILGNPFFQNKTLVRSLCEMPCNEKEDNKLIDEVLIIMKQCIKSEKVACMSGES